MLRLVLQMKNIIKNDIVDEDTRDDTNHNQNTGLREDLSEELHVVEDDLEQYCRDDHSSEHDGTGELLPLP